MTKLCVSLLLVEIWAGGPLLAAEVRLFPCAGYCGVLARLLLWFIAFMIPLIVAAWNTSRSVRLDSAVDELSFTAFVLIVETSDIFLFDCFLAAIAAAQSG